MLNSAFERICLAVAKDQFLYWLSRPNPKVATMQKVRFWAAEYHKHDHH